MDTIGERVKALRLARNASQEQFATLSDGALKRTYVIKIEKDRSNRGHRSTALRDGVARFAGCSLDDATLFVEGALSVADLLARGNPPPLPEPTKQAEPAATTTVEYDSSRWPSWRRVRGGVRSAMLAAELDAELVAGTISNLEEAAFKSAGDLNPGASDPMGFWKRAAFTKYTELRDVSTEAMALRTGALPPIPKSNLHARRADELDDDKGGAVQYEVAPPLGAKPVPGKVPTSKKSR